MALDCECTMKIEVCNYHTLKARFHVEQLFLIVERESM